MQKPPPLPTNLPLRPSPPSDWIGRNWKWLVPLLCLAVLVMIAGFVVTVFGMIKSSGAYSGAVARAHSSPAVIAALGTPITEGLFVSGNISEVNSSGRANLVIPTSGPKGEASIYVAATKSLGEWRFDTLIVRVKKTQERINLLETNQLPANISGPGTSPDANP
jgi:lipopolysaccharide export LptBFGC system permease protein LptF